MGSASATILSWITTEVNQALARVRERIARFVAEPEDAAVLAPCAEHLHQVAGALRMVGLAGATVFCEAIEAGFERQQGPTGLVELLTSGEVKVKAHSSKAVDVRVSLSSSQLAASRFASQSLPGGTPFGGLVSYGGVITANPKADGKGWYTLRIPWRAVPRAEGSFAPQTRA